MKLGGLRSLFLAATVIVGLVWQARADLVAVDDFSDLVLWAGSGTNSAAFILQFSATATPTAVAWGYRWSGTSTMQAMSDAIAGQTTLVNGASVPSGLDGRLTISGNQFSFGVFLNTIAYDQVGLPSGWSQANRQIVDDYFTDGTYPTLYTKFDAGGAWVGEGASRAMTFALSPVGASDIQLTAGGWYGFVQSTGPDTFAFTQPVAAVPEPSGTAIPGCVAAVVGAMAWRWRRQRAP
jgi:hypothetical protein